MFKTVIIILIIGVLFNQRVGSHEDLLKSPFDIIYKFFHRIFSLVYTPLRRVLKPINIGQGLDLDVVPFVVVFILLMALMLFSNQVVFYS